MDIGSTTPSSTVWPSLTQTPAASPRQQADATDSSAYQRALGTTGSDASNALAANFVTTESTSSKYIKATVSSLQTANSFGDRMGSLLDGLAAQYSLLTSTMQVSSGDATYAAATRMQHRVNDGVKRATEDEVADESARNLDDIQEDIEQRAEEATQPQNDAAQAAQTDTTGKTGTATPAEAGASADAQGAPPAESPATTATAATEAAGENAAQPSPASPETPAAATDVAVMGYAVQRTAQTPPATEPVDIRV